jgi:hypothetical protein
LHTPPRLATVKLPELWVSDDVTAATRLSHAAAAATTAEWSVASSVDTSSASCERSAPALAFNAAIALLSDATVTGLGDTEKRH